MFVKNDFLFKTKINVIKTMSFVSKKMIKKSPKNKKVDYLTTFELKDIDICKLDKEYAMHEIKNKQYRENVTSLTGDIVPDREVSEVTSSLEKLGMSIQKKTALETIYWGDSYKIKLYINNGHNINELTNSTCFRCSWCHQYPPKGSLMMGVPYKYVSSYVHDNVYSPECVNVVDEIKVKQGMSSSVKRTDLKSAPKVNYFKRDLTSRDVNNYKDIDPSVEINGYFETCKLVCSFNCMVSKGKELSEKDSRFKNYLMYVNWLYKIIFGVLPGKISYAPEFDMINEYGGDYTMDEYRKNFGFCKVEQTNQFYTKSGSLIRHRNQMYSYLCKDF